MLDDTASSVALGTAVGIALGLTPTVGLQMTLIFLLSFLLKPVVRFNRIAALISVCVSNPFTVGPIYWFNYKLGTLFVEGHVSYQEFVQLLHYNGLAEWWQSFTALFFKVGTPLFLGALLVAPVAGAVTYPVMLWLLQWLRRPHLPRRKRQRKPMTSSTE